MQENVIESSKRYDQRKLIKKLKVILKVVDSVASKYYIEKNLERKT